MAGHSLPALLLPDFLKLFLVLRVDLLLLLDKCLDLLYFLFCFLLVLIEIPKLECNESHREQEDEYGPLAGLRPLWLQLVLVSLEAAVGIASELKLVRVGLLVWRCSRTTASLLPVSLLPKIIKQHLLNYNSTTGKLIYQRKNKYFAITCSSRIV